MKPGEWPWYQVYGLGIRFTRHVIGRFIPSWDVSYVNDNEGNYETEAQDDSHPC